jgi:hypothetical protein
MAYKYCVAVNSGTGFINAQAIVDAKITADQSAYDALLEEQKLTRPRPESVVLI